jgi:hypothetical protein
MSSAGAAIALCAVLLVASSARAAPLWIEMNQGDLGNILATPLVGEGTVGGQLFANDVDIMSFAVAPGSAFAIESVFVNTSGGGIPGGGYALPPMFTVTFSLTARDNPLFETRIWELTMVGFVPSLLALAPVQGDPLPSIPGGETYWLRVEKQPLGVTIEYQFDLVSTSVPEPAAAALLALGLFGLAALRR